MDRRDFGKAIAGGIAGAALALAIPGAARAQHIPDYGKLEPMTRKKNFKMHVGGDYPVCEGASYAAASGRPR